MRKNYFIFACDEMYGGLHGMYDYVWLFGATLQDAEEYGYQMSNDVIDSYSCIYESFENDDEREYDICYEIYELKEDVTEQDLRYADKQNMDPREMIKKFCKSEGNFI